MKQVHYTLLLMWILLLCGCGETVECYWCKEDVKKGAKICKHCGKHPYGSGLDTQTQVVHSLEERYGSGGWPWWKYVLFVPAQIFLLVGFGEMIKGSIKELHSLGRPDWGDYAVVAMWGAGYVFLQVILICWSWNIWPAWLIALNDTLGY